jgi:hypothetical protein
MKVFHGTGAPSFAVLLRLQELPWLPVVLFLLLLPSILCQAVLLQQVTCHANSSGTHLSYDL